MKARIVVVEDEPAIQNLVVEELEDEGYLVATANNGKEGLEVIQSFKPHLILSDITMPVMNGHEMLIALREGHPSLRSVPIVFLSALADRRHIIEGKKLGVDDYVTKPIDFELLLVTIETRIREVERMTLQKEEQMLKLYQSFMAEPGAQSRPKPALVVCNQWADISPIQAALKDLGVPFVTHHRGSQLDAYLEGKTYSSIIMTDQTNDLSAKLVVIQNSALENYDAPKFLFYDDERQATDKSFWAAFDKVSSVKMSASILTEEIGARA